MLKINRRIEKEKKKWHYLYLQGVAHLHAILWPFNMGLRGRGRVGVGRVTAGIGVRGGADDDRLVELHDRSLDGVGERASGGGAHVHHHATLTRGDLTVTREGRMDGGKAGGMEGRMEGGRVDEMVGKKTNRQNISVSVIHFAGHL